MATETQSKYITDLAVLKTKEFKEVKEMLIASEIVGKDSETVVNAMSIAEINHALTDSQASQFIDLLISTKAPARSRVYSKKRMDQTIAILADIKKTIDDWSF